MSKELEYLREDYTKTNNEVEANNKILEDLLKNPLVQMYRDTYLKNEEKKKELETLRVSLAYQEMMECEHHFVRPEITKERDYDRVVREPIYHCLKCGLTNKYAVKEIHPTLLSKIENNMSYIFVKTAKNGILLHTRLTCPLDVAKKIYEEIKKLNPNITNKELQMYFTLALSKSDPTYYNDLAYEIRRLAGFDVKEDKNTLQRIELRLQDIETVEDGITCYDLSDFTKDLFEFVRTIKQKAGLDFTSLEDISKYPDLVIDELSNIPVQEQEARFNILAVPCSRAFVVAPEKREEFLNVQSIPDIRRQNEELAKKFRINNLGQTSESKKKVKVKPE